MKFFKNQTLDKYLSQLSSKEPIPGGGSAAALVGATGASLICMVAHYSQGRKQSKIVEKKISDYLKKAEKIRKRLIELVDLDAKVYLALAKTPKSDKDKRKKALKKAQDVPLEVCRLCYAAIQLIPFLAKKGNPYLLSDVECAVEMLLAAFRSAFANIKANQQ
ncbi:MAG: cyclodeaminase/cyclohydrolase family protein [Candidatus Omnitrophica bacterium]|nr:cyclodeaminase/cyclohydrolase family protein [Candidatus Omnitrophota bacterium]